MKTDRYRTGLHRIALVAVAAVLATMVPALPPTVETAHAYGGNCSRTSVGYVPISDGRGRYDRGTAMPSSPASAASRR